MTTDVYTRASIERRRLDSIGKSKSVRRHFHFFRLLIGMSDVGRWKAIIAIITHCRRRSPRNWKSGCYWMTKYPNFDRLQHGWVRADVDVSILMTDWIRNKKWIDNTFLCFWILCSNESLSIRANIDAGLHLRVPGGWAPGRRAGGKKQSTQSLNWTRAWSDTASSFMIILI